MEGEDEGEEQGKGEGRDLPDQLQTAFCTRACSSRCIDYSKTFHGRQAIPPLGRRQRGGCVTDPKHVHTWLPRINEFAASLVATRIHAGECVAGETTLID